MSALVVTALALLALSSGVAALAFNLWRSLREVRSDLAGTRRDLVSRLREAEFFRMAAEYASDGIVIQDMRGRILWPNPAYCRIVGRPRDLIVGRNPLEFAIPPDQRPTKEEIAAFRYSRSDPSFGRLQLFRNMRQDGELFWNQISFNFRADATGRDHAIVVCRDVTEQIEQEERLRRTTRELEFRAGHDTLTRLANRNRLMQFTEAALAEPGAAGGRVGMLHVDLDKFKEINDTHGHAAGDRLLCHVATLLREGVRSGDMVARVGGDEFVVACPGLGDLAELRRIAGALIRILPRPVEWNERMIATSASIGAALSPVRGADAETLLVQADFALYEAKHRGRNRVAVYDEALHERHMLQQSRAGELREAIELEALEVHFQPKMDTATGRVSGFETLVRWRHPSEGLISPDGFLSIAGDLGLMAEADLSSMAKALEMKSRLDWGGHPGLDIAFNASAELLLHRDFVPLLVSGVESRGIRRNEVTIEVLETTVFGDLSEESPQSAVIADLRDAGFHVVLDDFGTGFAGLAHLAQLPVSGVKIDRALAGAVLRDLPSERITRAIVDLCRDLDLEVVAEGVETADVASHLAEIGCHRLQGYWLSRPIAGDAVLDWLDGRDNTAQRPKRYLDA